MASREGHCLEDKKWEKGVGLEEALFECSDTELREEYERLKEYDYPFGFVHESEQSPRRQARRIRAQLELALLNALVEGKLVASGYDTRSPADAKPVAISPDRWRVMTPDFQKSSAEGSGVSLFGIRVFRNAAALNSHLLQVDLYRSGLPGRPTVKQLIIAEFDRRMSSGQALGSLPAEARELSDWAFTNHPQAPAPSPRTIENQIRERHRRFFRRKTTK